MRNAFIALALTVPAIVTATEEPSASLGEIITQQARREFSMIALQNPAPANKENKLEQISYLFNLLDQVRQSATQTVKGITSKETADELAIELGAKLDIYVGLNIATALVGLNADFSEEEVEAVQAMGIAGEENDKLLAQELHRIKENDFYGSDKLKAVMEYLNSSFNNKTSGEAPQVEVEAE